MQTGGIVARPLGHTAVGPPRGRGMRAFVAWMIRAGARASAAAPRASKIDDPPLTCIMARSSPAAPAAPPTYEQALAELEGLVQAMEAGRMPLDQLLASYQRGAELLQQCRARLQAVEDQVKLLEEGQLKPWVAP